MTTIKIKYKSDIIFQEFLSKLRQQYSCVYRYSYNRLDENMSKNHIYQQINNLNNVELIKSRMILDCIDLANKLYEKDKLTNHKSVFGGRKNLIQYIKGKITKSEYSQKRLSDLYIQGETSRNGNRYFTLDVSNNKIIFRYDRNNHYTLKIKLSKNQLRQLIELQETKMKYTITMNQDFIHISFSEIKHEMSLKEDRFIGIDLNPSNIGISVCDTKMNIIDTYSFEFNKIINKIKQTKKESNSKENKYWNNKLNYEILDISKRISEISKHYQCKFIFIEELNFKGNSVDKNFNRLSKNLWKRNIFIQNLEKRCNINGQKLYKVNPAYSSFIGNCMYDYVDPVNSSIEIGRRGYECIINKSKQFYPTFCLKESLKHQWKEMVNDITNNWKESYDLITKNTKLSYRVSLKDIKMDFDVFRKKVRMYDIYQFN
jgi:IS605 OrfB family transposase